MNLLIVTVNIAVFLALSVIGDTQDGYFMLDHGACFAPYVQRGEYCRLFTSMFLHFGVYHLANNMICLIFLGDQLEEAVGSVKYLLIYLVGGLAGNILSVAFEVRAGEAAISAGASGAIFAVIGALLYIVIRNRGRLGELSGRRLAVMTILSVWQGFIDTGTDNAAHIGGLMGGFVLAVLLYRKRNSRKEQVL